MSQTDRENLMSQLRKMRKNRSLSAPPSRTLSQMHADMSAAKSHLRQRRRLDRRNAQRARTAYRKKNATSLYRPTYHPQPWKDATDGSAAWSPLPCAPDCSGCPAGAFNDVLAVRMRNGLHKGEPQSLLALIEQPPTLIQPVWEPPEANGPRTFGTPHTAASSRTYVDRLERHLSASVSKLEVEYEAMPERVLRERDLKGDVGRDIECLKGSLRKLRREKPLLGKTCSAISAHKNATQRRRPLPVPIQAPEARDPISPQQYGIDCNTPYGTHMSSAAIFDLVPGRSQARRKAQKLRWTARQRKRVQKMPQRPLTRSSTRGGIRGTQRTNSAHSVNSGLERVVDRVEYAHDQEHDDEDDNELKLHALSDAGAPNDARSLRFDDREGAVSPCSITSRTGEMQNFDAGASFTPPPPGCGPSGRAASITCAYQAPMNVSGRAYQDA